MGRIHTWRGVDRNGIHQKDGTTVLQQVQEAPPGHVFYVSEQQRPIYEASAAAQGRDDLVFKVRQRGRFKSTDTP